MSGIRVRLVVELDSIEVGPRGSVTGRVFFKFDSGAFPDGAWNDFVLVITRWWLEALAPLQEAISDEAELFFMDGPFAIRLRRRGDGDLEAEFIEHFKDRVVRKATVQQADFIRQVSVTAKEVLSFCEATSAARSDVEALRAALNRISAGVSADGKR